METVNGFQYIGEFPAGEPIVSMITFKGECLIATSRRVYRVVDGRLIPMEIVYDPTPVMVLQTGDVANSPR